MKAKLDQNNLACGYAHLELIKEPNDKEFFSVGDSIAIGHAAGDNSSFFHAKGGSKMSREPAALVLPEKPLYTGDTVIFLLTPDYVDYMPPGEYLVVLLARDGKEKNRVSVKAEKLKKTKEAEREAEILDVINESGERAEADAALSFALSQFPSEQKK